MNLDTLRRLAPLSLAFASAFAIAACASSDGNNDGSPSDPEEVTPQENAAASATPPADVAADGAEPTVDPETKLVITTPAEPSASWLDEEEARLPPEPIVPGVINLDSLATTSTCHKATGYRSGHKFTICLTTIDGHYVEVNTARAYLRMRSAARKASVYLQVVSGFRSMAEQRYLYHCYETKACNGGNLAAVPGYSNHQSGHALDLNTSAHGVYSWLTNHGHTFGFHRTVPSEIWHWEH